MPPQRDPCFRLPSKIKQSQKLKDKAVNSAKKQTTPLSDVQSPIPPPSEHPSDDEMDYDGNKDQSQGNQIIEDENDLDKQPSTINPVINELNQQFHQEFGHSQHNTLSSMTRPAGSQPSFHLEDLKNLRQYTKLDNQHFLEAFTILNEFERIQEGSQVQPQAPKDKSDEISTDGFAYSNAFKMHSFDHTFTNTHEANGSLEPKDREVKEQFFKMVREMHRRLGLAIRERLLKNIINSKGDLIEEGPIPLLHDIARTIFQYLHPAKATMTDADVDKAIPVL
ncbi:hypothetical protein PGT21_011622 [Puccinia graminis f. sp. tritici]|uniref:Uncharacterized protein n=1 Tax=Puccinia graminis f. sp. tritici TaxID=56615 RepID=A0A5B0QSV8_PUCGR|nr:hypothetical protein PGT21_011622 [Puccinia graminis f. sp. tritici]